MAEIITPTRAQLDLFTRNHRVTIAFEELFNRSNTITQTTNNDASLGISKANQAIATSDANETRSKSNKVLLWLSM